MSITPGRIVGIAVGAIAILGIGVYGPAMLLGPLPTVTVTTTSASGDDAAGAAAITLPDTGASAIAALGDDGTASTLATAGDAAAVPIGGAAKLVTVLTTLESLPLAAGGAGPAITIGPDDYTDYLRYASEDSRTLAVLPGETWTQRDVVRAVLLASSNNHADTLARWAFGGVEPYVEAANEWLAAHDFATMHVADATGLSGDNIGTAEELTRLGALVLADPRLAELFDAAETPSIPGERDVPDVVSHLGESGVRALSRSYTDQAGVSFVFTTEVAGAEGDPPHRLVSGMTLMPDYDTLDAAVQAAIDSSSVSAAPVEVISAGTTYARVESAWGDRADLIASVSRADAAWGSAVGETSVTVEPFTTASAGREIGRVSVETADGEVGSPLELTDDIRDPGPLWRLTNPGALIGAFFDQRD
ncbi:hypothetical protein [Agromyces subbeticus]|uniref:hypothetical protein n=1 Tax=Agromyces subbeticus TaxID=293890 RepID=UPI0003B51925|nr:hypothetical protein [Agromyces subbeticus]